MSFGEGPSLRHQYWWTWGRTLRFILLRNGRWIHVTDHYLKGDIVHLKDRYVDLTRITSNKS